MRRHATQLVLVVLMAVAIVGVAPMGVAHACSCAEFPLFDRLSAASVVVSGHVVDSVDNSVDNSIRRYWLVEVDERWFGDTPPVIRIDLIAQPGDCDDWVTTPTAMLLLGPVRNDHYDLPACGTAVTPTDLDAEFAPRPLGGTGPPVAIVPADASGYDLAIIDGDGVPLAYLPGEGPTYALSMCPGDDHFVQVRGTAASRGVTQRLEAVRWRLSDWSVVEVVPLNESVDQYDIVYGGGLWCGGAQGEAFGLLDTDSVIVDGQVVDPVDVFGWWIWSNGLIPGREGTGYLSLNGLAVRPVDGDGSYLPTNLPSGVSSGMLQRVRATRPVQEGWEVLFEWPTADYRDHALRRFVVDPTGNVVADDPIDLGKATRHSVGLILPEQRRDTLVLPEVFEPPSLFARTGSETAEPIPTLPDPIPTETTDVGSVPAGNTPAGNTPAGNTPAGDPSDVDGRLPVPALVGVLALLGIGAGAFVRERRRRSNR